MGMFGSNPGLRDKFSQAGDFLLANAGSQAGLQGMQATAQAAEQNNILNRQMAAQAAQQAADAYKPQAVNLGNGGFGTWSPSGGFSVLREPAADDHKTTLQQNVEFYKTLNPNATPEQLASMAERGITGYQYGQPYMQQKQADALNLAQARGAITRANKAAPSYSALHPKPQQGQAGMSSPLAGMSTDALIQALRSK